MSGGLTRYEAACRALAEARSIDEAKDIRDKAIAMQAYARQAKNRDLEADAIEIRMRATRRLDQLRQAQKETVGLNRGAAVPTRVDDKPTLASQGIDKNLAHNARKLGALSEEQFEAAVADARIKINREVWGHGGPRTIGTGENERYTPAKYIELARSVLGEIDLDPASCEEAQRTVKARKYFSRDALIQEWGGRVWLKRRTRIRTLGNLSINFLMNWRPTE